MCVGGGLCVGGRGLPTSPKYVPGEGRPVGARLAGPATTERPAPGPAAETHT